MYLRMLIYWVNVKFQFREHLIEFTSLDIEHIDHQLMMKLMKILKNYIIKNKLFKIVINNASNNSILKEKLEKIMSCCKFQWDRTQNFINCLIYIINLMFQDFIQALKLKIIADNIIAQLKNEQMQDIKTSRELSVVIKKILLRMIMQKSNTSHVWSSDDSNLSKHMIYQINRQVIKHNCMIKTSSHST